MVAGRTILRRLHTWIGRSRAWLRRVRQGEAEWIKRKALVDRDFDAAYQVDTGGITDLRGLTIAGPSRRAGVNHAAADPDEFAAALDALAIDHRRFTFIDYGAGKGRALLMAATYPYARILGVEFAEELVQVARANLIAARAAGRLTVPAEILLGDAIEHRLPETPTVLFLYNPFDDTIMRTVAADTARSLQAAPRPFFVVYLNPFHVHAWIEAGFTEAKRGPQFVILEYAFGRA